MTRLRPSIVGAALLLLGSAAPAAAVCNTAKAHADLAALDEALQKPQAREAQEAAKADLAAGKALSQKEGGTYLILAAVALQLHRYLDSGNLDEACKVLQNTKVLRDTALADGKAPAQAPQPTTP